MTPEEIVARVLYRDGLMLVIDKPAGMAVHRGPKGGESLEDFFAGLRFGLPRAPALAHRLDRDTSGCLVLGRHRKALAQLGQLFKSGRVGKTYWAVVAGGPDAPEGRIDLPLGRLDPTRGWWMRTDEAGQPAATTWRVLGRSHPSPPPNPTAVIPGAAQHEAEQSAALQTRDLCTPGSVIAERQGYMGPGSRASGRSAGMTDREALPDKLTWLALEPLTGRTHQLRVHCAAMGWPIVGDSIYGDAPRHGGPGLQLHAREVVVPLYKNRDAIGVTAPVPAHMREMLAVCGWAGEAEPFSELSGCHPGRAP